MVKAGGAVDKVIDLILLDKEDIIMDGGNSYFQDTRRRAHSLKKRYSLSRCRYLRWEEGARLDQPMPGGHPTHINKLSQFERRFR